MGSSLRPRGEIAGCKQTRARVYHAGISRNAMQKMEWNKEKTEKKAIIVIEDTMQMCFSALDTKLEHQRCDGRCQGNDGTNYNSRYSTWYTFIQLSSFDLIRYFC